MDRLGALPPELKLVVFSFLHPYDTWRLRRLSQQFRIFLSSDAAVTQAARLDVPSDPTDSASKPSKDLFHAHRRARPVGTIPVQIPKGGPANHEPCLKGHHLAFLADNSVCMIDLVTRQTYTISVSGELKHLALSNLQVAYADDHVVTSHRLDSLESSQVWHSPDKITALTAYKDHLAVVHEGGFGNEASLEYLDASMQTLWHRNIKAPPTAELGRPAVFINDETCFYVSCQADSRNIDGLLAFYDAGLFGESDHKITRTIMWATEFAPSYANGYRQSSLQVDVNEDRWCTPTRARIRHTDRGLHIYGTRDEDGEFEGSRHVHHGLLLEEGRSWQTLDIEATAVACWKDNIFRVLQRDESEEEAWISVRNKGVFAYKAKGPYESTILLVNESFLIDFNEEGPEVSVMTFDKELAQDTL